MLEGEKGMGISVGEFAGGRERWSSELPRPSLGWVRGQWGLRCDRIPAVPTLGPQTGMWAGWWL